MKNYINSMSGFTLVEVLVAIMLTSLAFMIFLQALNTGKMVRVKSELRTRQSVILNSIEHQVRATKFDEQDSAPWTSVEELGKESGETSISQFDDIDDFHEYTVNSLDEYPGFGYNISVFYSSPPSSNEDKKIFELSNGQTNYKSVAISVVHATLPSLNDTLIITPKW